MYYINISWIVDYASFGSGFKVGHCKAQGTRWPWVHGSSHCWQKNLEYGLHCSNIGKHCFQRYTLPSLMESAWTYLVFLKSHTTTTEIISSSFCCTGHGILEHGSTEETLPQHAILGPGWRSCSNAFNEKNAKCRSTNDRLGYKFPFLYLFSYFLCFSLNA